MGKSQEELMEEGYRAMAEENLRLAIESEAAQAEALIATDRYLAEQELGERIENLEAKVSRLERHYHHVPTIYEITGKPSYFNRHTNPKDIEG